jgi:hypothetical protein
MQRRLFLLAGVSYAGLAHTVTIREVWKSSQEDRLRNLPLASVHDPNSVILINDFVSMIATLQVHSDIELRVVTAGVPASMFLGHIVVVRHDVAQLTLPVRRFIIAHEVGHVVLGHYEAQVALYESHIPGEVVQENTDRVATILGPLASQLSHRIEYEADAFALRYVNELGFGLSDIMPVFMQFGVQQDTATHPGTRKRLAHLRSQEAVTPPQSQ